MNEIITEQLPESNRKDIREKILFVEAKMRETPGCMVDDCFPLKHTFADGMYIREITVPKGNLIITKIHKLTHPYFLLKGDCSVLTEEGVKRIKAPYSGITPAGTKRIVYVHEDTVWITVHATRKTDLKEIEDEVIAKTYDEMEDKVKCLDFIKEVSQDRRENICHG